MKPYGVATDQFAGYVESVHYKAMVETGDLTAPTCTTCHGSHGAAPPGVVAVANVCATCHVLQGKFFEESPHKQAFAKLELPSCVTCSAWQQFLEDC
jgi:predicted CXXCH cytochrome family protein